MSVNYDEMPPQKRLTEHEMEQHLARLTAPKQPTERHDPFEVCPTKHITTEELDKMTERLYTKSLEQKAASMAQAELAAYGPTNAAGKSGLQSSKKLSPEEQEQAVERLYTQSIQSKQAKTEQLRKQHLYHSEKAAKKVSLDTFVQHMYTDRLEAKKKTEQRLHDLYIAPTEIKTGTITKAQMEESANRLSTKSGA